MMSMNIERIEALAQKYCAKYFMDESIGVSDTLRYALTEQAETHAIELRAYEATVGNLTANVQVLHDALSGMVAIAHDSKGAEGYHLNGDIAEWYSFPEYEAAVIALAAVQQQKEGA